MDVIICAVSTKQVLEQKPLIRAIKEAGRVKVSPQYIPTIPLSLVNLLLFLRVYCHDISEGSELKANDFEMNIQPSRWHEF